MGGFFMLLAGRPWLTLERHLVADRPVQPSLPTSLVGAQYNFGLRDIAGERYNPIYPPSMLTPTPAQGVFVSGPFHIDGMPEIIRKDAEVSGSVDCYLIDRK